ncbi:MAG: tetratricopeptide repeat protein [Panacagrimonas sp.]
MKSRIVLLAFSAMVLAACASSSGRRESTWPYPQPPVVTAPLPQATRPSDPLPNTPAPVEPAAPIPIEPEAPGNLPTAPQNAGQISGQAVLSLMKQADESQANGQFDLAASQLERAQRIEPRNYFVWAALAQVYLDQQQFDQAISVATKSNSLARGNAYVEIENWKTIAAARTAQGDSIGALQAEARVDELERVLGGG